MKRFTLSICAFFFLLTGTLFAQSLDRAELENLNGKTINFINYSGPTGRIDTVISIRGIGNALGLTIQKGRASASDGKYSVQKIRGTEKNLLDADVLELLPNAGVDHIRNLRLIISGYLESAYGYSRKDADLLANFITVYNAVYRKDLDYVSKKYSPLVVKAVTKESVGLSVRWDEWAGKSRILIPFTYGAKAGSLGAVDTTSLSDKAVVDNLKKDADKGLSDRQDLTDLKERTITEDKKAVEETKTQIAKDEKTIADEKAALEKEKAALEKEKANAETTGTKGDAQSASLVDKEKELADKEAAVKEKEAEVAKAKEETAAKEASIADKEKEVAADRAGIAQDQKEVIAKENNDTTTGTGTKTGTDTTATNAALTEKAAAITETVLLFAEGSDSPLSKIVVMNLKDKKKLRESEINSIRGRTLLEASNGYIAVAGASGGSRTVKLVIINKKTLTMESESKEEVFADTLLIEKGGAYMAIIKKGTSYSLGLFNAKLELTAESTVSVHPYTQIAFKSEGIVVQTASGSYAILDNMTLKEVVNK